MRDLAARQHRTQDDHAAADGVRHLLLYGIPPVWIGAGIADWLCHRASRIETNSGLKESLLHIAMLAELGGPVVTLLFFELTWPLLLFAGASLVAHQLTALWDLRYAERHRRISPVEQQVHSFLELTPMAALALSASLRWRTIDRRGVGGPALRIRRLPQRYVIGLLGSVALFNGVPYLEEAWRCARARRAATTRLFVFGTLKRGFPLHDPALRGARFLGRYRTAARLPMMVAGPRFAPMMLDQPGAGAQVAGELYEVDDVRLAAIDALESIGVPGHFRRSVAVEPLDGGSGCNALVYLKAAWLAQPRHTGWLADYQDRRFTGVPARGVA